MRDLSDPQSRQPAPSLNEKSSPYAATSKYINSHMDLYTK